MLNHRAILPVACLLVAGSLDAAEVKRSEAARNIRTVPFQSEALGRETAFNILLPLNYETSTNRYPTLYLLHGLGDDNTAWSYMTNLSGYAAKHDFIVVMPDVGRNWYVNSAADPKARYEDLIIKDLIPYVDSHFRTIPLPRARAVAGLSMGGYGAALFGLKHYQRFAAMGIFSGAVGIANQPPDPKRPSTAGDLQKILGPMNSPERQSKDPFVLLEKVPPARMPMIYIACGGQDFLIEQNRAFVKLLASREVPYEYREISPRVHSWDFWDDHVRIFLDMLAELKGFGR